MLRFNKRADYGILILTALVQPPGGRRSASEIARSYQLSRHMVASILKDLSRAGLVQGDRGVRGGYTLVPSPEQVSLLDVIEALDGPFALLDCCGTPGNRRKQLCDTTDVLCDARPVVQDLNDKIRDLISDIHLTDLMAARRARLAASPEAIQA